MDIKVENNPVAGTYDAIVDGKVVGMVVCERANHRVIVLHTIIEPEYRGRGIGNVLVRETLDDLLAQGLTLTNFCGFITKFIASNPEYARVLDTVRPGVAAAADARRR